jgi:hypothetical protein
LSEVLPTVVSIDVEPDRRPSGVGDRPGWDGWDACHEVFSRARRRFEDASGAPAHWSWFFRTDPQMAAVFGDAGHALATRRARVDDVRAHGDETGVHCHPYRLAEDGWVDDYEDRDGVLRAVEASLDAFERATSTPCRSFRLGAHHMGDDVARLLARRGVFADLTVEPGFPPIAYPAEARVRGTLPDYRRAPRRIWLPDGHFLRPAAAGRAGPRERPWMIPLSTGTPERTWRGLRRRLRNLLPGTRRPRPWAPLCLVESRRVFSRVLDRLLSTRATTHLSVVVRSDAGLPALRPLLEANLSVLESRVRPHRLRIVRPDEAIAIAALAPNP